jgi:hypothetical protein
MRSDMFKVIVERPRTGGSRAKTRLPRNKSFDEESICENESMRIRYKRLGDWKQLNENLRPLQRFLAKNVGRPLDKVWSEICQGLNTNSTVQKHVLDHAIEYVNKLIRIDDGVAFVVGSGKYSGQPHYCRSGDFYVDSHGILCVQGKVRERVQPVKPITFIDGDIRYGLINGCWFELLMKELPEKRLVPQWSTLKSAFVKEMIYPNVMDAYAKVTVNGSMKFRFGFESVCGEYVKQIWGKSLYCYKVRQISSKEIKRLFKKAS